MIFIKNIQNLIIKKILFKNKILYNIMEEEIIELKLEIINLKEQLKKYTNRPSKNRNYYERHKQDILEKQRIKYHNNKLNNKE